MSIPKQITLQSFQAEMSFESMKRFLTEDEVIGYLNQKNFEPNIMKRKKLIQQLEQLGWLKGMFYSILLYYAYL